MSLIDRIEGLSKRVSHFGKLEGNRAESARLQKLLDEALGLNRRIEAEVQQFRLMHDEGMSLTLDVANAEAARTTLARLREGYAKENKAESLTKGRDWTLLEKRLLSVCENVATALEASWQNFVHAAYSGESPEDLGRSLASTDRNVEELKLYRQAYADLKHLSRTRPETREDFSRVRDLARRLTEIYGRFDFDVPEDVKCFLREVAGGGAGLDLLTEEVRDWLRKQKISNHYRVIARMDPK